MPLRIFISYSSRDRLDGLALKEVLESDGHEVWMDQFDISPGAGLTEELRKNVSAADVLCLLLSPAAVASPWVREEVQFALSAQSKQVRLLPIVVRAAPIPEELADVVAVDAMRGLRDDAVIMHVRKALGGDVGDALILDAIKRGELADRAAIEAAEVRWPALREALDRVIDQPIRQLTVSIDQDSWPDSEGSVVEVVIDIDIFTGALHILLAPYVEGRTWRPDADLAERPPQEFLGWVEPRVDGRLLWAGRTLTGANTRDGTDLGEMPLQITFDLPGDEYTGEERGTTMALLERFELPSLRSLVDAQSDVTVWQHPREEGEPRRIDPAQSDLRLRIEVPLRHDDTGLFGFRLWGSHDRDDVVLWGSPTLTDCGTDLEREALLSLYRNVPLRTLPNSPERRSRLAEAVERGEPVDESDRWAAFSLAVGRADVPRLRGRRADAAQLVHEALGILGELDVAQLDYPHAFRFLTALTNLVNDLTHAGGTEEAIGFYADQTVDVTRRLWELHSDEPDYARALSRALFQRARTGLGTVDAVSDVDEGVALVDGLVTANPLPWRLDEARDVRRDAESLLGERDIPAGLPNPSPQVGQPTAPWLDPTTRADVVPTLVFNRLLRFGSRLPPPVPVSGPHLTVQDGELLGIWDEPGSSAGLVVGLADASTNAVDAIIEPVVAGAVPGPLPGEPPPWTLVAVQEDSAPPDFADRLEVDNARAFRLELRHGDEAVHGYLLVLEDAAMRWRVCLTLPASGDDWQARAHDDSLAAVVFTRLSVG
jgi:hypothetical protein